MTPTTTPAERVAATVRAELARQRKTQGDLARALGISGSAVNRRLVGALPFDIAELHATAAYLGIPITALIREEQAA